ncbi:MAG: TrmH family RNA methyltransferase, partial [Muribaculaceae bacterium]|nr:TrmH family RNA methyltransferase [Muribaculaceae bacterium]
RSLNNIGSIFRTSDAFGVVKICLCGITATPPSPEIHKTALGAEDSVEWEYFDSTDKALAALRAEGYIICALEQAVDSVALQDFKVEAGSKYAIVAGHEVNGVDQAIVDSSDFCIEIPQVGTKHSLNVSVSTGVALWHFFEQMINGK